MSRRVVVELEEWRERRQAGCGHSITHRRDGQLKCSWCGKVLEPPCACRFVCARPATCPRVERGERA